jgi:ferredoxin
MAAFLAAILTFTPAYSFVPSNVPHTQSSPQTSTSINIFGGLADAFKSDDSLGKAANAGLSNGPRFNDQVTVNGKAVPKAVVDQKISQVCASARVKVSYNCQNGECKTCTVKINGRKAQACVSKVPAGKCAIQTL